MPNYYEIKASEFDLSLGQQGFNILSGSGTYVYDTINETTGSKWNTLYAANGNVVVTAQCAYGQDLTANGLTYDSGSAITILSGTSIVGPFKIVKVTSGIVIAYRG